MRKLVLFAAAISALYVSQAAAECVGPEAARARMKGDQVTVDTLSASQVGALAKRFQETYKNSSKTLQESDAALVFHRPDANNLAWVILFKDGCAVAEGPMEERVYSGIAGANSGAKPSK